MLELPPLPSELHIGANVWEHRWHVAKDAADLIARVQAEQASGKTEAEALAAVAPNVPPSTYRRWRKRFGHKGTEGLMDQRQGKDREKLTPTIQQIIAALRLADPDVPVERIAAVIAQRMNIEVSPASIRRVLVAEGLNRPPGKKGNRPKAQELHFAGGILFQLADEELGWSRAMAEAIVELRFALPEPAETAPEEDGRDAGGRFTAAYNQAHCKGEAALGPAFRSIEEKRKETDLASRRAAQDSPETLLRKVRALLALPLLTDTNRCISLGDYRGGWGVAEFAGGLYRGETLDRCMRDLKYLGADEALRERHASFWMEHAPVGPDGTPSGVCVYVDGVSKPLWTAHFAKAGKVSSTGRVMPCVDQVLVHTGMGTPIFWQSFPGHASLVTQTLPLLKCLEGIVGNDWMADKLVIIDGEGHAAGLFKQFKDKHFVTMLRGTAIRKEEDVHDLGPWQPFREGDEIAEGWADLPDSHAPNEPYRARIVLVRRKSARSFHALASSAPNDYDAAFLAKAYFQRWPAQELRFRDFNQGVGFKQVHGYGKRLVQNVTVLTELDRLQNQRNRLKERLGKLRMQAATTREALTKARRACNVAKARRVRQDGLVKAELTASHLDRSILETRIHVTQAERDRLAEAQTRVEAVKTQLQKQENEIHKAESRLPELDREIAKLESRKEIYQPDTALDSIATTFKLGFALLCEHLILTYFAGMRISLHGLMHRILSLPGTRTITGKVEHIHIRASRDRDLMLAVEAACARVNERKIIRNGRTVKLSVDWEEPAQLHGSKRVP